MVTIEQKLTLFSKLLQQDIKDEAEGKMLELDTAYEKKMAEDKEKADKDAEAIIANAIRRAEAKKVEIISKSKMASKKETMIAKERYINTFIERLKQKINVFTGTEDYKAYLESYLVQFEDLKGYQNSLTVYLTTKDYNNHKKFIKEKLVSLGLEKDKLSFETTDDSILGGIIIEDPRLNMRIDTSIASLIQESKEHIIECVFGAIGEGGETLE